MRPMRTSAVCTEPRGCRSPESSNTTLTVVELRAQPVSIVVSSAAHTTNGDETRRAHPNTELIEWMRPTDLALVLRRVGGQLHVWQSGGTASGVPGTWHCTVTGMTHQRRGQAERVEHLRNVGHDQRPQVDGVQVLVVGRGKAALAVEVLARGKEGPGGEQLVDLVDVYADKAQRAAQHRDVLVELGAVLLQQVEPVRRQRRQARQQRLQGGALLGQRVGGAGEGVEHASEGLVAGRQRRGEAIEVVDDRTRPAGPSRRASR